MRISPVLFLAPFLALTACDSDDPGNGDGAGDEELITSVRVALLPQGGGTAVTLTATDDNGDGVGVEYDASGPLAAGTTYNGTISLRDDPNDFDVTEEIDTEREAHLFVYGSSVNGISTDITDSDANGFDVGLEFTVTVAPSASGAGTFDAALYHFESGAKQSSDDRSDETDIDLSFPISVQ